MKRFILTATWLGCSLAAFTQWTTNGALNRVAQEWWQWLDRSQPIVIPFRLEQGIILIQGHSGENTGYFILDTGAPGLMLNQKVDRTAGKQLSGITGTLPADELSDAKLDLGNLHLEKLPALAMDLGRFERALQLPVAGLIGHDVLKNFEIMLDYNNRILMLWQADNDQVMHPRNQIRFEMQQHLPIIEVQIGDRKLQLAVDSGAESNILHRKWRRKLGNQHFNFVETAHIQSPNDALAPVEAGVVPVTKVKGMDFFKMRYLSADLGPLCRRGRLKLDGLLGFPFLSAGLISINFQQRTLYVWEKK